MLQNAEQAMTRAKIGRAEKFSIKYDRRTIGFIGSLDFQARPTARVRLFIRTYWKTAIYFYHEHFVESLAGKN